VLDIRSEGDRATVRFTRRDRFRDPAGRLVTQESPPIEKRVVRTAGEPLAASKAVSQAVHEVDPGQPLSNVTTVDGFLKDSLGAGRFRSVVLVVFAALGLLLASVGIYGVTARGVAERARVCRRAPVPTCGDRLAGSARWPPWPPASRLGCQRLAPAAALRCWLPGVETARPAACILALAGPSSPASSRPACLPSAPARRSVGGAAG
jgi:hypothetical protein